MSQRGGSSNVQTLTRTLQENGRSTSSGERRTSTHNIDDRRCDLDDVNELPDLFTTRSFHSSISPFLLFSSVSIFDPPLFSWWIERQRWIRLVSPTDTTSILPKPFPVLFDRSPISLEAAAQKVLSSFVLGLPGQIAVLFTFHIHSDFILITLVLVLSLWIARGRPWRWLPKFLRFWFATDVNAFHTEMRYTPFTTPGT